MIQHALIVMLRPALCATGLALSLWMLRQSTGVRGLPGCGAGSGCDAAARSRWARWCGVPVAAPAALVYLLLLVGLLVCGAGPSGRASGMARAILFPMAALLAAAALWFTGLQWLVIRRPCIYCLLLHAIGVGLGLLILSDPAISARETAAGWTVAGVGVLALVLGQVLVEPRMYVVGGVVTGRGAVVNGQLSVVSCEESAVSGQLSVVSKDGSSASSGCVAETVAQRGGASDSSLVRDPPETMVNIRGSAALRPRLCAPLCAARGSSVVRESPSGFAPAARPNPFASRRVVAVNGRVAVEGGRWPVLGSPDAACMLVYLFDYTCRNCRDLHEVLLEAMREDSGGFAVMLAPVPRDPRCNPAIVRPEPEHANACAYARLGLSVWADDWGRYAEFDRFLFEGKDAPPLGLARARAGELLGREVFDPTVPDAGIDPAIRDGIELYKRIGPARTPTVLMPVGFFTGRVSSVKELRKILDGGGVSTKSEVRNPK